jgi:hypothetical protein
MSYVIAAPEIMTSAATDLSNIGSTLSAAHSAAAAQTTGVLAAGADEVSAAIAALFSVHGQSFQALSAQAAAFHSQFVQSLSGAGSSYALAEAANASPLQAVEKTVLNAVNSPTEALFGRMLIGDGATGTASAPNGQDGGSCTATAAPATPASQRVRPAATAVAPG